MTFQIDKFVFGTKNILNVKLRGGGDIIVTGYVLRDLTAEFKIEHVGEKRRLIGTTPGWKNDDLPYPTITIHDGFVTATYYKNGLFFYLKDANGNIEISTAMDYTETIFLIGETAVENGGEKHNFINLLDENWLKQQIGNNERIVMEDGNYKIFVKTGEGMKKITISRLFAIFLMSVAYLLEVQSEDCINGYCLKFPNNSQISDSHIFKKAIELTDGEILV